MAYNKDLSWIDKLDSIPLIDCNDLRLNSSENRLLDICKYLASELIELKEAMDCTKEIVEDLQCTVETLEHKTKDIH